MRGYCNEGRCDSESVSHVKGRLHLVLHANEGSTRPSIEYRRDNHGLHFNGNGHKV